jgi:serine/threonine protein phosphatase PrpC
VEVQGHQQAYRHMRATAVVLAIDNGEDQAIWGNLGDSRLYGFRNRDAYVRTRDHSIVQRMVDAGYVTPEKMQDSLYRSRLFAALGDAKTFEPNIEANPQPLLSGDAFLLCTDGCWEHVHEDEITELLRQAQSSEAWLGALEHLITERGGDRLDNYSAIAVWCDGETEGYR